MTPDIISDRKFMSYLQELGKRSCPTRARWWLVAFPIRGLVELKGWERGTHIISQMLSVVNRTLAGDRECYKAG
jgi:hypothetical protein